jgi:dGTPase
VRRLIDLMATDLIEETRRRLAEANPATVADLRRLGRPVVSFSPAMRENDRALKAFLFERMYRHYRVNRMTNKARRVVRDLFELYVGQPDCLPPEWHEQAGDPETPATARLVADYIAGMTDRYALDDHRRLFDIYDRPR